MKALDFVIIGAQKGATTTLFELLRQHPEINMPLEKEVPFFSDADYRAQRWPDFASRYFGAEDGRLWGKASPQYMADMSVPGRLAARMPDTRLIAVLRNPLERTRSHYRMGLRRGTESRSFRDAVADNLTPATLHRARHGSAPTHAGGFESEGDFYIAWSEYGRILTEYRRHFPAPQLLVLYTDELEAEPRATLDRVLNFLELDETFRPNGLGEVMHAGGGSNRVPHGLRIWLRERTLVAGLWNLVPPQKQGRLRFLYERWNTSKVKESLPLPAALEASLRHHFGADLKQLQNLGVRSPAWADDFGDASPICSA